MEQKTISIKTIIIIFLLFPFIWLVSSLIVVIAWMFYKLINEPGIDFSIYWNNIGSDIIYYISYIIIAYYFLLFLISRILRKKYSIYPEEKLFSFSVKKALILILLMFFTAILLSRLYRLIFIFIDYKKQVQYPISPLIKVYHLDVLWGIYMVILPPIVEEYFFRGIVLKSLSIKYSNNVANIIASLLFASVHFRLIYFPYLFLISYLIGYAYLNTKNLKYAILMHFINNLVAVVGVKFFEFIFRKNYDLLHDSKIVLIITILVSLPIVMLLYYSFNKTIEQTERAYSTENLK